MIKQKNLSNIIADMFYSPIMPYQLKQWVEYFEYSGEIFEWGYQSFLYVISEEFDIEVTVKREHDEFKQEIPAGTLFIILDGNKLPLDENNVLWIAEEILDLKKFEHIA